VIPLNVHTDHPAEVLVQCARLAAVLRTWAWAMANSDVGANLDADSFAGIAQLAHMLESMLREAEQHVQQQCACFPEDKEGEDIRWVWPMKQK
jgi:hypothetical protein